jgi:hypothetical protein
MRMNSTSRITGVAIAWMLQMVGCGAADDDGTTSPSTSTDATDSATETSENPTTSDSDTAQPACNGGAACAEGEYCSLESQSCDCDSSFDYCELSSMPPGCYPVPTACGVLMSPDRETCIAANACRIGGQFIDGTLECERYDECAGDCDFDPDSCMDSSSSTATGSGSSESGSTGDESSSTG